MHQHFARYGLAGNTFLPPYESSPYRAINSLAPIALREEGNGSFPVTMPLPMTLFSCATE